MKKYLLTALTAIVIVPAVSTAVSQTHTFIKNNKSRRLSSNFQDQKNKVGASSDNINWNYIEQTVDNAIDNPDTLSSMLNSVGGEFQHPYLPILTAKQRDYAKQQAQSNINKFQQLKFTTASQVTDYLKNNNQSFKDYYNNPVKAATDLNQKILFQYFTNKIDLKLDGANTYQDAVDTITNQIKAQYGAGTEIKVTLKDEKTSKQTLFDDTSSNTILSFVENEIAIPVTVQVGANKSQDEKIQLKNLTLSKDNQLENKWLTEAVSSYFDGSNPQNLNIKLSDTRQMAFDKILAKIQARFPGYDRYINLTLSNPQAASQNFYNSSLINDIANEKAWIGVHFNSAVLDKNLELWFNFNLDYLQMNELINQLYLTGSSGQNLQDLNLTTDNTYQNVIDNFNQRLNRLDSQDNFIVALSDSSQAGTKLQDQYKPDQENQTYTIKINFQVKIDSNTTIKLGETDLSLTNVGLGAGALAVKKAYDDLQELLNKLTLAQNIVDTTAVVLGVAAAAFWATAWFFGITTAWAIACTAAGSALGAASAALYIAKYSYDQKIASLWQGAILVWKINRLGVWLGLIIYAIIGGTETVLTATTWANMGLAITAGSALMVIYAWIEYYKSTHSDTPGV